MRIRFVEEFNPINNRRCYYTERRCWGAGWLYISDTLCIDKDNARMIFDRIVETGAWNKTKNVLAEANVT